jgi:hypothetical protein
MREYLEQVGRVAETGLYYVTLQSALVIPDMCAGLEANDGKSTGALYEAWFDEHVAPRYVVNGRRFVTGEDCWGLRCAMLHLGRFRPHRGAYERVVFVEPHGQGVIHNNVMGNALSLEVTIFTRDMIESAEDWLETAEQTDVYQKNLSHFMQRYPNGLVPFISGVAVIA